MALLATETLCNERQKIIRDLEWTFVQPLLPSSPGRFLDVGCGTGYQMAKARALGFDVCGVDPRPNVHGVTGGEPSDTLSLIRQGTAQQLPCSDASFDVVFSSHALVELNDVPPALREAHRVLKPNGRLVLVLSTSIMAWVRLMSLLMFETHHHVGAFLRSPSRENLRRMSPASYRGAERSAWTDISAWSVRRWKSLISPLFEIETCRPTFFYTFPDYRPFLLIRRSGRFCSSVVITARPKPAEQCRTPA